MIPKSVDLCSAKLKASYFVLCENNMLWSKIRPNWTEKSSNNPVGDQNCLKNDCVKTVFFNSVFEIFVLKVCVLKHFQKMTVYVENVDFRKTHQAC